MESRWQLVVGGYGVDRLSRKEKGLMDMDNRVVIVVVIEGV